MKYIDLKKYKNKRMPENTRQEYFVQGLGEMALENFARETGLRIGVQGHDRIDMGARRGSGGSGGAGRAGLSGASLPSELTEFNAVDTIRRARTWVQESYPLDNNSTDASI